MSASGIRCGCRCGCQSSPTWGKPNLATVRVERGFVFYFACAECAKERGVHEIAPIDEWLKEHQK